MSAVMPYAAGLLSTGIYLPEYILHNRELEKRVDTTSEWIRTRTGIEERRVAADDVTASMMGARAAAQALERAGVSAEQIGLIIVATSTPDMVFPSTACLVQQAIGARKAFCFDLAAACSGYLYALETARQFVESGSVEVALVIGSEKMSCITDWQDRSTCVLFGDGAGAAVVGRTAGEGRLLKSVMGSDGTLGDLLKVPAGGSLQPATAESVAERMHTIKMQGRDVYKHAVTNMVKSAQDALAANNLTIQDIQCIIPHQANARIIQAVQQRLGASDEQLFMNVARYGNTSAASIIVALDEALETQRIKRGDRILFVVFGGGFTWGATVVEW